MFVMLMNTRLSCRRHTHTRLAKCQRHWQQHTNTSCSRPSSQKNNADDDDDDNDGWDRKLCAHVHFSHIHSEEQSYVSITNTHNYYYNEDDGRRWRYSLLPHAPLSIPYHLFHFHSILCVSFRYFVRFILSREDDFDTPKPKRKRKKNISCFYCCCTDIPSRCACAWRKNFSLCDGIDDHFSVFHVMVLHTRHRPTFWRGAPKYVSSNETYFLSHSSDCRPFYCVL